MQGHNTCSAFWLHLHAGYITLHSHGSLCTHTDGSLHDQISPAALLLSVYIAAASSLCTSAGPEKCTLLTSKPAPRQLPSQPGLSLSTAAAELTHRPAPASRHAAPSPAPGPPAARGGPVQAGAAESGCACSLQ